MEEKERDLGEVLVERKMLEQEKDDLVEEVAALKVEQGEKDMVIDSLTNEVGVDVYVCMACK